MTLTVAIIGRPNVGKSTLFNRLVGRRLALVDETPGVTRDRREGTGRIADLEFRVFDTAGLEDADDAALEGRMRLQTEQAVGDSDVVLMVIDARAGVTPLDAHFARWLRREGGRVVLVANKCEGSAGRAGLMEAFELGLGEPVAISAEHGEGMADLYEALVDRNETDAPPVHGQSADPPDGAATWRDPDAPDVIRLAVVGRPNVGKSTLINALLGENRVLTGPEAGITRDAIEVSWRWRDQPVLLVDTAGLRRRSRVSGRLERASGADTTRAIRFAHVVILVMDANMLLERQDLAIARMIIEEGRALVLAINKWDAVADRALALRTARERIADSLPQVRDVPWVTVSALHGRRLDQLLDQVRTVYDIWNRRVSTAQLNRWLAGAVERHSPPIANGRRVRLRYATQIKTRPPSFACFCSQPDMLPASYVRYLTNGIRDAFDLPAVPIRFVLRRGRNPYNDERT